MINLCKKCNDANLALHKVLEALLKKDKRVINRVHLYRYLGKYTQYTFTHIFWKIIVFRCLQSKK